MNIKSQIENYLDKLKSDPNNKEILNEVAKFYFENKDFDKALQTCIKITKIDPTDSNSFNNIGMLYKFKENEVLAIENYKQALLHNPYNKQALNNLGVIYHEKNQFNKSIELFKKAISVDKFYLDALNNLITVEIETGSYKNALENCLLALKIDSNNLIALFSLGTLSKKIAFKQHEPVFEKYLINILNHKTLINPKDLCIPIIKILNLNPEFLLIKNKILNDEKLELDEFTKKITQIPLLLKIMALIPIPDLEIEILLTKIRKKFLLEFEKIENRKNSETFLLQLSQNCLANEFIFFTTTKEKQKLEAINNKIKFNFDNNLRNDPLEILILSSYKQIINYDWHNQLKFFQYEDIFKCHVNDYYEELDIKSSIEKNYLIDDQISVLMKKQYEQYPYPRWVNISTFSKKLSLHDLEKKFNLNFKNNDFINKKIKRGLIAGCGTGQQSINAALNFPECNFMAIDLSETSLAYAIRKTNELGITNINYIQNDILNLKNFKKKFDYIECAGVLHHMKNPLEGWKILTDTLETKGIMKIGLYSKLARRELLEFKKEIEIKYESKNIKDVKKIRNIIINDNLIKLPKIFSSIDFFSTSGFKDLLLNENEIQFNLIEIKEILSELNLRFCGFQIMDDNIKNKAIKNDEKFDNYNLSDWHYFEEKNHHTFQGMYQFWCQKL